MKTVNPSTPFAITGKACPECGGEIYCQVDEWETATGVPTEAGVIVGCTQELETLHSYNQADWVNVTSAVSYAVRRNVLIKEAPQ